MRLTTSWLLPAFITAASAVSDASVYLLEAHRPTSYNPPTLSPEQARLVFAQRLGASRYHSLEDASAPTLSYINQFGGQHEALFEEVNLISPSELVLIVEDVSSQVEEALLKVLSAPKPDFFISGPPSAAANMKLVGDVSRQIGQSGTCAIQDQASPLISECWSGGSKIIRYNLSNLPESHKTVKHLIAALKEFVGSVNTQSANALLVLTPKGSSASNSNQSAYGFYEMPTQATLDRRQFEEPLSDTPETVSQKAAKVPHSLSNSTIKPITGVPAVCHSTLDSCTEKTNNCSGHGKCYKKRSTAGTDACFACGCQVQKVRFTYGGDAKKTGFKLVYWGGAACQKKDVSGPFWLIGIFTVVLLGLVSWAIGLMYSIGEEKLPGVIGAGVSNNRAR